MRLLVLHPQVAHRPCSDCRDWMYDEKTGKREQRGGKDIPRPRTVPTPCWDCPKGSPENERHCVLSEKNWAALNHFIATRNGGLTDQEAADPIVRRNRGILEWVFHSLEHESRQEVSVAMRLMGSHEPASNRRRS